MPDRSLTAYDSFKDLTQRAEYLTMGALTASIGFFWQTHEPQVLRINPSTLHLLGMLVLFIASGGAFRRIHLMPQIYGVMTHDLDQAGKRDRQSLRRGPGLRNTGAPISVLAELEYHNDTAIGAKRSDDQSPIDQLNE